MAQQKQFIHLRLLSLYSLLESTLKMEDIISLALKYNMPALAVTDRNNLFGALEFSILAQKSGIQPINGVILNLKFNDGRVDAYCEILLLAKDVEGFQNLLKLSSIIYTQNSRKIKEHITINDLEKHNRGLLLLSGYDVGIIGQFILSNSLDKAESWIKKFKSIFHDRFYMEITRQRTQNEKLIENKYIKLAHKHLIPLVATNKVVFDDITKHSAYNVLRCIATGSTLENIDREIVSNQSYFKSCEEMIAIFKDIPESIENTLHIAKRCCYFAEKSQPILPKFADEDEQGILLDLSRQGLDKRLELKFTNDTLDEDQKSVIRKQYLHRLQYELKVICNMNFAGYFLIVSDFIKWAKSQNIAVGPGRGSGVGSIVAWSLLITDIDPIKFGLLFERFLNPERVSMPDFDIDFCQERREEVVQYVREKYGNDRVANIITFGKLQAKAAIKDVARVMGLKFDIANHLTELVPFNAVRPVTLSQAVNEIPELKKAIGGKGLYQIAVDNNLIQQVLKTALTLEGLCRHVSVHAAGIVIAGKPLVEMVPLYKDQNSDSIIIQYSMKMAEEAGLVKFDFLGLQTLTVISKCQALLQSNNISIDFNKIGLDDQKTYNMLSSGNSSGVFQFESIGMQESLKKLQPDNINDIVALGALYRPGPMDNIPIYIACKHKEKEPDYIHPLLVKTLQSTYGVCVYQEQVMEIAKILAGYTLSASDVLRRVMGKKVQSDMNAQEKVFIEGAKKNNIKENDARKIFALVAKFAGYGFNKSHAVAYGIISYQTAYCKANYPIEFFISYLNLEINDQNKIFILFKDMKSNGIEVIPPSANQSSGYFIRGGSPNSIVFALGAIKNITPSIGEKIFQERSKNGPYHSIINFIDRNVGLNINKRALENLIKAGAFDDIHSNRNSLLKSIPRLMSYLTKTVEERLSNQFSFKIANEHDIIIVTKEENKAEKAEQEMDVTGIFLSGHPLDSYVKLLDEQQILFASHLKSDLPLGSSKVLMCGVIHKKDTRMSGNKRFTTLNLSDHTGFFEATIFDDEVVKLYGNITSVKSMLVLTCEVYRSKINHRITIIKIESFDSFLSRNNRKLVFDVEDQDHLKDFLHYLKSCTSGNMSIKITYPISNVFKAIIVISKSFKLSPDNIHHLQNIKTYHYGTQN